MASYYLNGNAMVQIKIENLLYAQRSVLCRLAQPYMRNTTVLRLHRTRSSQSWRPSSNRESSDANGSVRAFGKELGQASLDDVF